jgi:glutaredoxin
VPQPKPLDVVLLSAQDCELCQHAKEILRRVSIEYPLDVRTVSLDSTEGQQLAAQHGVLFAPGLLLDGETFSYGRVSERKLRRELSRREATFNSQEVMQ